MSNPIPENVRKIWGKWNIRGAILLSLSLQAILFLLAPLRKGTKNKLIIMAIWSVYLLSDWAAIFALGLISNNQGDTPDVSTPAQNTDLLAFWTPFLILHLGGPDNITAFALEDNELWFRHFVGLLIQAVAALYIFLLSLSKSELAIPTVVMFIAASIKYLERTRAFYLASFDGFQDSTFKELPYNSENGYNKFMDEHKSKLKAELPAKRDTIEEPDNPSSLNELEVMHYAYYYFGIFKGIVIDLILEVYQHQMSRDFFGSLRAKDALRIIEVELNLIYEVFYTKAQVVYSLAGFISRSVFLGLVVAALSIFHFKVKKHDFDEFDIAITYALFLVAIILDIMAVFILISYDLTVGTLMNPNNLSQMKFHIAAMLSWVLTLKKPRWYACNNHSDKPTHEVLATPFLFGRWSGYVSGYNLLRYCVKGRPTRPHKVRNCLRQCIEMVIRSLGVEFGQILGISYEVRAFLNDNCLSWFFRSYIGFVIGKIIGFLGLSNFVDEIRYVSHELLTNEFWEFIVNELRERSHAANDSEEAVKISSARGTWTLRDKDYKDKLMPYLTEVTFDESVLLWHIATELLYQTDEQCTTNNHQEFSKVLSDYMLYILIMNSTMMSTVVGIAKIRFRDTCTEITESFGLRYSESVEVKNACESLIYARLLATPNTEQAAKSKSVLADAILLAQQLKKLDEKRYMMVEIEEEYDLKLAIELPEEGEEIKWKVISKVWVELLSYAACYSTPRTHIEQVSKGGELITFVWFLMAHFGLRQQFHTTKQQQTIKKITRRIMDSLRLAKRRLHR